jgi:hypothetical protein
MSHFAKVENGIVTQVIVAEQDFINTGAVGNPASWVQTSYNTRGGVHYQPNSQLPSVDQSKALRKNYAGIGYTYDSQRDAFYAPSPFPSWVLDEETCIWNPPYAAPQDNGTQDANGNTIVYTWDEAQHTSTGNGWVQSLIPPIQEETPQ